MKKFSNLDEEIQKKYELKDLLRNEIYSLIDETISIKITNENSLDKDVTINGKDELVEKIKTLIESQRLNERVKSFEFIKSNVYQNFDMKWLNEQISILKESNYYDTMSADDAIESATIDYNYAKKTNSSYADKVLSNLKDHLEEIGYDWKSNPYSADLLSDYLV